MEKPNQDSILLNYDSMNYEKEYGLKLSRPTFFRGVNECIEHKIIAPSYASNFYFVNPAYIYNGNRVTRIHEFILKSENGNVGEQIELKDAEELATIAQKQDNPDGEQLELFSDTEGNDSNGKGTTSQDSTTHMG